MQESRQQRLEAIKK